MEISTNQPSTAMVADLSEQRPAESPISSSVTSDLVREVRQMNKKLDKMLEQQEQIIQLLEGKKTKQVKQVESIALRSGLDISSNQILLPTAWGLSRIHQRIGPEE